MSGGGRQTPNFAEKQNFTQIEKGVDETHGKGYFCSFIATDQIFKFR